MNVDQRGSRTNRRSWIHLNHHGDRIVSSRTSTRICSSMHAFLFSGKRASHSSGRIALLACSMALSYKSSSSLSTSGGAEDGGRGANKTPSGGGWSGELGWNFGRGPSQPGGGADGEAGGCCLGGELVGLGGAAFPTVSFIRGQEGKGN